MKSSEQEQLDRWLEPIRNLELTELAADEERERRADNVEKLAETIRLAPTKAHSSRGRRMALGLTAAAAAVALFGIGYALTESNDHQASIGADSANLSQVIGKVVATDAQGRNTIVSRDTEVTVGDEVRTTGEAFASLELVDQARVDLSSATTVRVTKVGERSRSFHLQTGRVDVNVPHVNGNRRELTVTTPNAQVSVRGTIFHVEVSQLDDQTVTRVSVSRGAVAVRHEGENRLIRAGDSWSSHKEPEQLERETAVVEQPDEGTERQAPKANPSSLAVQNKLFQRGLRARDRGDDEKAVYWFEKLMRRYPSSPLLGSARAERNAARTRLQQ